MRTFPARFDPVTPDTDDLFKIALKRELGEAAIASHTWSTIPEGPTFHDKGTADDTTTAQNWITNFTAGVDYVVVVQIVTSDTPARTFEVRVPGPYCLREGETDK